TLVLGEAKIVPIVRSMQPVHGAATTEVIAVWVLLPSFDSTMSSFGSTLAVTDRLVPAEAVTVVVIVTIVVAPAARSPLQSTFPTGPVVGPAGEQTKPPEAAAESRLRPAGRVARTTTVFGAGSDVVEALPVLVTVSV